MTSSLEKIIFLQLIFCLSGRVFQNFIAINHFFIVNYWIEIKKKKKAVFLYFDGELYSEKPYHQACGKDKYYLS